MKRAGLSAALVAAVAAIPGPMVSMGQSQHDAIPTGRRRRRGSGSGPQEQLVNPKRRERRKLEAEHGITTGRQWVRLRRQLKLDGAA